jgi:hypothetical protein
MLPKYHFLIGLIFSVILYFVFPGIGILNLVVFLVATVFIDVDHYLYYVYLKGDWSLGNAVRWFNGKIRFLKKFDVKKRRDFYTGFCFLHGIEVLILFLILGYFVSSIFYFICLGFAFHLILDYIHGFRNKDRFDKFSIIYDYFKYGKLRFVEEIEGLASVKSKRR